MVTFELCEPLVDGEQMTDARQVSDDGRVYGGRETAGAHEGAQFPEVDGVEGEGHLFLGHWRMIVPLYADEGPTAGPAGPAIQATLAGGCHRAANPVLERSAEGAGNRLSPGLGGGTGLEGGAIQRVLADADDSTVAGYQDCVRAVWSELKLDRARRVKVNQLVRRLGACQLTPIPFS